MFAASGVMSGHFHERPEDGGPVIGEPAPSGPQFETSPISERKYIGWVDAADVAALVLQRGVAAPPAHTAGVRLGVPFVVSSSLPRCVLCGR